MGDTTRNKKRRKSPPKRTCLVMRREPNALSWLIGGDGCDEESAIVNYADALSLVTEV
jgi:hypothetical protein